MIFFMLTFAVTYLYLTNKANVMSQTTDQELQQETQQKVIQKLNQLLNYGDSPVFVLNTLQDVQQNFINTFDSADDELLKDGNLILSELNKILTELAFNQK